MLTLEVSIFKCDNFFWLPDSGEPKNLFTAVVSTLTKAQLRPTEFESQPLRSFSRSHSPFNLLVFNFEFNIKNIKKLISCSALRESRFSRILENFFEISLLDLESFLFHFHFSISISSHFHFTFISRKE